MKCTHNFDREPTITRYGWVEYVLGIGARGYWLRKLSSAGLCAAAESTMLESSMLCAQNVIGRRSIHRR